VWVNYFHPDFPFHPQFISTKLGLRNQEQQLLDHSFIHPFIQVQRVEDQFAAKLSTQQNSKKDLKETL
jgi:hypothetical protein